MSTSRSRTLRVVVTARAAMPLHGLGGLERSVRDLVRHLARLDVDVTLVTPPPRSVVRQAIDDPFASPRIRLRHVPYLTFPFANRRGTTVLDRSTAYLLFGERAGRLAASFVRASDVDIVHGFGASVLGYARQHARLRAPLVLNPQGLEEFGATGPRLPLAKRTGYAPLRWAVRRVARAADAILATDHALKETVERHLKPAPDIIRTIPNGIDLVEVSSLAGPPEGAIIRQRNGIAPDAFVMVSVGRLERNKGFDVLVDALARARASGRALAGASSWRWVLIGSGPEKAALDAAIARAGLGAHVLAIGRASDAELHAWYEAATVFVHPTRYEGSSLVTLEAMAHRRPIIATRAGGLPDKVHDGVNGWLVDPDDADGLATAVERAAGPARHRLPDMGTASRTMVEQTFAWPTLAKRHVELYEELLARQIA